LLCLSFGDRSADLGCLEEPEQLDPASAGADPEALIEEARQRARRRRLRYAAATAVLALIAVSLIIVLGRSGPSLSASPASPVPAGAPDPGEAASIVACTAATTGGTSSCTPMGG
jgi:hypothetical protein